MVQLWALHCPILPSGVLILALFSLLFFNGNNVIEVDIIENSRALLPHRRQHQNKDLCGYCFSMKNENSRLDGLPSDGFRLSCLFFFHALYDRSTSELQRGVGVHRRQEAREGAVYHQQHHFTVSLLD